MSSQHFSFVGTMSGLLFLILDRIFDCIGGGEGPTYRTVDTDTTSADTTYCETKINS